MTENIGKNPYQEIAEQLKGFLITQDDLEGVINILQDWNEAIIGNRGPKIDKIVLKNKENIPFTFKEFKSLIDNNLLSNDYFKNYKYATDLEKIFPSMSKNGIINMINYNKNKYQITNSNFHFVDVFNSSLHCFSPNLIKFVEYTLEEFKNDGKVHFIAENIEMVDHLVLDVVVNGKFFKFDTIGIPFIDIYGYNKNIYSMEYLQQTDSTSCKAMVVKEMDSLLKILTSSECDNYPEKFYEYLSKFFSKKGKEYYINIDNGEILEEPKIGRNLDEIIENKKLALLPIAFLKHLQSITSQEKIRDFILELKISNKSDKSEYAHIINMHEKLDKMIKKHGKIVKLFSHSEAKRINLYALNERLKQAKILAMMQEKGLIIDCEKLEKINLFDVKIYNLPEIQRNIVNNMTEAKILLEKYDKNEENFLNLGSIG